LSPDGCRRCIGHPARAPHDIYNVVTVFKGGVSYDSMKLREAAKGRVGIH